MKPLQFRDALASVTFTQHDDGRLTVNIVTGRYPTFVDTQFECSPEQRDALMTYLATEPEGES